MAYPLATTGLAGLFWPEQASGSLVVMQDGRPVGSRLIGQSFRDPGHFWGRPSATSPQANNASASGGANLGPSNPALRAADPGNDAPVPADLVTTSASGLDPHISVAAALYQAGRVARARGPPLERVVAAVERHREGLLFGFFGEPRVNVLLLNLELDTLR
jgi:K+-transporting ATPase ATPase C chain